MPDSHCLHASLHRHRWAARVLSLPLILLSFPAVAQESAAAFWSTGRWPDGRDATATLPGGEAVRSTQLHCAGCHGLDARGRLEGGVEVPPVDGSALRAPRQARGHIRPTYTSTSFERAVRDGIGSDGRALLPVMPRYGLSPAESASLWTFLSEGAPQPAPGFDAREVRVGVWQNPDDAWARAVRAEAERWSSTQPRVYGRSVRVIALAPRDAHGVRILQASTTSVAAVIAPPSTVSAEVLAAYAASGALIVAPPACAPAPAVPQTLRLSPAAGTQRTAGRPGSAAHPERELCPAVRESSTAPAGATTLRVQVAEVTLDVALSPLRTPPAQQPACRVGHAPVWTALAPLLDAQLLGAGPTARGLRAADASTQGRLHALAATRLLGAWLAQVGATPPTREAWPAVARSGRLWATGVSAQVSWGPQTAHALDELWLVPDCGTAPARTWRPVARRLPAKGSRPSGLPASP